MLVEFCRVMVKDPDGKDVGLGALPEYKTAGAAGADVKTLYGVKLKPGESHLFDLGLIVNIPRGHYIAVHPRSGLSCKNKVLIPNSPGVIDSDYKGPNDRIKVMLFNASEKEVSIEANERIAQLIIHRYERMDIKEADQVFSTGSRGGFGGTGRT